MHEVAMIVRTLFWLAGATGGLVVLIGGPGADAQGPGCRFFKVQANSANVSKEPRGDAFMIDVLDKDDIVCVTREQKVGDRDWVFIIHKLEKPNGQCAIEGWTNLHLLQPLSDAELAAVRGNPPPAAAPPSSPAPVSPPAARAAPPPAPAPDAVLRYSEPIPFGPYPVNGRTFAQLIDDLPMFPPIEGLPEAFWKKKCSACHQWDQASLCTQGTLYVTNPSASFRHPHPYGGALKVAMQRWAQGGCQ
jgi:hypothetical protein